MSHWPSQFVASSLRNPEDRQKDKHKVTTDKCASAMRTIRPSVASLVTIYCMENFQNEFLYRPLGAECTLAAPEAELHANII